MIKISFQGVPGAYSEEAALINFPNSKPIPCNTFMEAFEAVQLKKADLAMIPVENLIAGRVADVHSLLPKSKLFIIAEYFHPIDHHLLALPGVKLEEIKHVISHVQGLSQCRNFLDKHKMVSEVFGDTAGAAQEVFKRGDRTLAAIASQSAGKLYGLQSVASGIADNPKNMTRFLVLAPQLQMPDSKISCITTIVFAVKSVPAALYKSLGGFASNGINLTRIESYLGDESFLSSTFSIDVEGHPESESMKRALEELQFFAYNVQILGVYPAHQAREKFK